MCLSDYIHLDNTIRKEKISQLVEQIKRKSKKMDKKRKKVKVSTPKVSKHVSKPIFMIDLRQYVEDF